MLGTFGTKYARLSTFIILLLSLLRICMRCGLSWRSEEIVSDGDIICTIKISSELLNLRDVSANRLATWIL